MSARRRAEPGSQHHAGVADLTDFAGRGSRGVHNGHSTNGYGGVHRAERQPASVDFRAVLGNFATGVTIITALDSADLNRADLNGTGLHGTGLNDTGLNDTALGSVSAGGGTAGSPTSDSPTPIGFTCQAFTSLSLDPPLISFAVSRASSSRPRILAAGRFCVNILAFDQRGLCARFATPGIDRFAGVDWRPSPGGSPVLDGSLACIDCTVEAEYPGGDHTIVIGHVRGLSHLRDAAPLVYHRGEFASCFPAAGSGVLPRVG